MKVVPYVPTAYDNANDSAENNRKHSATYYAKHPDIAKMRNKAYQQGIKREAIEAYGGACVCCGQTESAYLTFHHKNNDGKVEREGRTAGYASLLKWRKLGWPDHIELLCANCHFALTNTHQCPCGGKYQNG